MSLELALLIPDTHRPYHSVKAYNLMLQVAKYLKPSEIVILGDYADFYSVSSHPKDPRIEHMLKAEIEDVNDGLDELDRLFPRSKKVFIEGNHEYRLERYFCDKAPELFGVTDTQHILNLHKRPNWKFVSYGPNQAYKVLGSLLTARHEPLASNARLTASKALCSLVYGHIHRLEESHIVGLDGSNHVCFSVGWLGDSRKDRIFDYVKGHHQWQLGFGLVWVNRKTGCFYHNKVHILNVKGKLSCSVNGKLFTT